MADASGSTSRPRDEVYLNFIGGQWRQGSSPDWDENRNPARPGEVIGKSTRSTPVDVAKAIEAAQKAQVAWNGKSRIARAAIFEKVAHLMRTRIEQFAKTITIEEGKSLTESRAEVQRAVATLEFYASEGRRELGTVLPSEQPGRMIYTARAPLGVVGLITPWSSPLGVPVAKLAPALLEGNGVVFKPSTLTPGTAKLLVFTFEEAGLPAGVLNLVYGQGSIVGPALVQDMRVRGVSFSGSTEVGRELYALAARRLIKVQLELGGKNALIVCADADLDAAADAAVTGAFSQAGQRNCALSRVIVERSVHRELVNRIVTRARQIRVGDGLSNPDAMSPIVDMKQYKNILKTIEDARTDGAALVCGGEPCTAPGGGHYIAPTIFDEVRPQMSMAREELFGPLLAIMPVDGFEQALEVANSVDFGLAASVYTRDMSRMLRAVAALDVGMVQMNSPVAAVEVQAPIGGIKASGLGEGAEFFCEPRTIHL